MPQASIFIYSPSNPPNSSKSISNSWNEDAILKADRYNSNEKNKTKNTHVKP
jgi:hypothetical protein